MAKRPSKRKLLLVNNGYPDEQHPSRCAYMHSIHNRLVAAGFDVTIVTIEPSQSRAAKLLAYGRYWLSLIRHLRLDRFDVIYAHHINTIAPVLWVFHRHHRTLWVHWHGSELRGTNRLVKGVNRLCLTIARRLPATHIAPSAFFAEEVAGALQRPVNEIHVSPSGGLEQRLAPINLAPSKHKNFRIGFAGHLTSTKGFPAIRTLVKQTFALEAAIGRSVEWHMIRHVRIDTAALKPVIWHDPYKAEDMPMFYRSVDLLISPSEAESLGLSVLEAIYNQCPVIVPDRFAFREFVTHGTSGLLYDPEIPTALFDSVIKAAHTRFRFVADTLAAYHAESVEQFYASL